MPTGWRSEYLMVDVSKFDAANTLSRESTYLDVISNVVPKICARTNSAILTVGPLSRQ